MYNASFIKSLYEALEVKNNPNTKDKFYDDICMKIKELPPFFYGEFIEFIKHDKFIKKNYCSAHGKLGNSYIAPVVSIFNARKKKALIKQIFSEDDFQLLSQKIYSIACSVPEQKKSNFDKWVQGKIPSNFKTKDATGKSIPLFSLWENDFFNVFGFNNLVFDYLQDRSSGENHLRRRYEDYLYTKQLKVLTKNEK